MTIGMAGDFGSKTNKTGIFMQQHEGQEAQSLFLRLVKEYAEHEDVTEQLKAENPMERVQKMNNIRSRATETVCADLIFAQQQKK